MSPHRLLDFNHVCANSATTASQADWAALPARLKADPIDASIYASIRKRADALLAGPWLRRITFRVDTEAGKSSHLVIVAEPGSVKSPAPIQAKSLSDW